MTPAEAARELGHRLDAQGRLSQWPTKRKFQRAAVFYLIAKFERDRPYTEPEVGAILDQWAPFRDAALLRRTMIEERLLSRTPDGSEYRVAGTV
ncbi:MAG: DUF2087 domain-containing protein [Dehalococcoidia bacterium]